MCQCSTPTFERSYGSTVLDMPESKEMTEQIDWLAGKATITGGWLHLGRSEVLRSLRHYIMRAQSQGNHTIDRVEETNREERESAQRPSLRRRSERAIVIYQTNIGTVSRETLRKLLRDGVGALMGLPERNRYHLELN